MSKNKIVYQNWIVELGYDPTLKKELNEFYDMLSEYSLEEMMASGFDLKKEVSTSSNTNEIKEAVRLAISNLNEEEQEFIARYYFMGESQVELAEKSNRQLYKLTAFHKQILSKLKKSLTAFVKEKFSCDIIDEKKCLICLSADAAEINKLIKNRDKSKTWRPILKILREQYQINLKTPQIIIGHEKYHI